MIFDITCISEKNKRTVCVLFSGKDRHLVPATAPACGLCLENMTLSERACELFVDQNPTASISD